MLNRLTSILAGCLLVELVYKPIIRPRVRKSLGIDLGTLANADLDRELCARELWPLGRTEYAPEQIRAY